MLHNSETFHCRGITLYCKNFAFFRKRKEKKKEMSFSRSHFLEAFGLSLDHLLVFTEIIEYVSMLSKAISWEVLQFFSWETGFIIHAHIGVTFVSPL